MNQKGFGLVEGLLIFIAITLVAFGGYYVWNENQDSDATETTATEEASQQSQATEDDNEPVEEVSTVPEGWVEYDTSYGFSFAYPQEWGEVLDSESETGDYVSIRFANADSFEFGTPILTLLSRSHKTGGGGPSQQFIANGYSVEGDTIYAHSYVTGLDEPDLDEPNKKQLESLELRNSSNGTEYVFAAIQPFNTPQYYAIFNIESGIYPGLQVAMVAGESAFQGADATFSVGESEIVDFVNTISVQ